MLVNNRSGTIWCPSWDYEVHRLRSSLQANKPNLPGGLYDAEREVLDMIAGSQTRQRGNLWENKDFLPGSTVASAVAEVADTGSVVETVDFVKIVGAAGMVAAGTVACGKP